MRYSRPRPRGKALKLIIAYGVAWFAGYTVVLNQAEHHLDAGTAAMLVNVAPILVAVSAGLLLYPVLQAADILIYSADEVPVGADQRQHVELTRDIAQRCNHRFGDTFTLPTATFPKAGARVMDLQLVDAKMKRLEPAMEQMKKAHEGAKADFDAGIKKVLNEKQAKKWDSWKDMEKKGCGH